MHLRALLLLLVLFFLFIPACGDDDPSQPETGGCQVTVTRPTAQDILYVGQNFPLGWTDPGASGDVRITLRRDGQEEGVIKDLTANDGYYGWDVALPQGEGSGQFVIRVAEAHGDTSCYGDSPPVSIVDAGDCGMTFSQPWVSRLTEGEEFSFSWTGTDGSGALDLYLYRSGEQVARIGTGLPRSGSRTWTVDLSGAGAGYPFNLVLQDQIFTDCQATSVSFTIEEASSNCLVTLTPPLTGQVLTESSVFTLEYSAQETGGPLVLELLAGSELVGTLADNLSQFEVSYDWTVTDLGHDDPQALYFLRLSAGSDSGCAAGGGGFYIR